MSQTDKPVDCTKCGKTYASKKKLQDHQRVHNKDRFCCTICTKKFSRRTYLNIHLDLHSGVKPFECHICKLKLTRKENLNQHLKIHSEERPFICDICSKRFKQKKTLSAHIRYHSGVKPHECALCLKRFTRIFDYNTHVKIHLNVREYVCSTCQRNFLRKKDLDNHIKNIHVNQRPFVCEVCQKGYTRRDRFVDHARVHHNMIILPENEGPQSNYMNLIHSETMKKEMKDELESNKTEFCVEVPLIKHEIDSDEDLNLDEAPSCSNQNVSIKEEPMNDALPTFSHSIEVTSIKTESESERGSSK